MHESIRRKRKSCSFIKLQAAYRQIVYEWIDFENNGVPRITNRSKYLRSESLTSNFGINRKIFDITIGIPFPIKYNSNQPVFIPCRKRKELSVFRCTDMVFHFASFGKGKTLFVQFPNFVPPNGIRWFLFLKIP